MFLLKLLIQLELHVFFWKVRTQALIRMYKMHRLWQLNNKVFLHSVILLSSLAMHSVLDLCASFIIEDFCQCCDNVAENSYSKLNSYSIFDAMECELVVEKEVKTRIETTGWEKEAQILRWSMFFFCFFSKRMTRQGDDDQFKQGRRAETNSKRERK